MELCTCERVVPSRSSHIVWRCSGTLPRRWSLGDSHKARGATGALHPRASPASAWDLASPGLRKSNEATGGRFAVRGRFIFLCAFEFLSVG